jgi:predicted unusual protein kinase regulating ubiquinone biosynthesis (AarF/ABC1/UbiB family)
MIRTGTICLSFIYNYLKSQHTSSSSSDDNKHNDDLGKKAHTLKCLKETFENYGGVFSKLAQLLCFADNTSDNKVFSECKPVNMEKTIVFLKNEFENNRDFFKDIDYINYDVYKSGSVGQVHKGKLNDGSDIILKVQYIGLEEQIKSDLVILEQVINFLYSFADLTNALKDIKTKLYEELDYNIEFKNHSLIANIWKDDKEINIAKLLPEVCSKTMLGMYFVEGESLHDFIINSTQEEKNDIAFKLIKFIFTNIYKHNIFYSDIHYGNFLVTDKKILNVMDFGCLNEISNDILSNIKLINKSLRNEDLELFYQAVKSIGIINDDISPESKEYVYEYMKLQYSPWNTKNHFHFTDEFLEKSLYKNTTLMKEWKIPPSMVYLNKIPYGLFHVLTKLNASGDFYTIFNDLIL